MGELLLATRKFRVERREYPQPGHGTIKREMVVHPGAVLILPLLPSPKGDQVVLIHNYRYSAERELLELPAGTLDPGEPPEACAARELEEETGYKPGRLEPLCAFYTTPGFTNEFMHAFLATELEKTSQHLDETEQIRVEIMRLDDAIDAAADGRIIDGKTIAALLTYHYRATRAAETA
jgi:ADP-ribose pyrophosphatase